MAQPTPKASPVMIARAQAAERMKPRIAESKSYHDKWSQDSTIMRNSLNSMDSISKKEGLNHIGMMMINGPSGEEYRRHQNNAHEAAVRVAGYYKNIK